jgi:hypothetical protein
VGGSIYDAFTRIGLAARVATSRAIAATVAVMYVWLSRDRRRRSRLRQRRIADVEQAHLAFAEFARDRRNRDRVPLRIIATVVEMDELVSTRASARPASRRQAALLGKRIGAQPQVGDAIDARSAGRQPRGAGV